MCGIGLVAAGVSVRCEQDNLCVRTDACGKINGKLNVSKHKRRSTQLVSLSLSLSHTFYLLLIFSVYIP